MLYDAKHLPEISLTVASRLHITWEHNRPQVSMEVGSENYLCHAINTINLKWFRPSDFDHVNHAVAVLKWAELVYRAISTS